MACLTKAISPNFNLPRDETLLSHSINLIRSYKDNIHHELTHITR